ncbi:hypothetical protein NKH72_21835 [Mesorhizobium sp. M0955]|uniref:hypothetical protein n=1 Tax=Mesorhizobium sp. M0955 TaxID=2957033 RepID=UPI003334BA38
MNKNQLLAAILSAPAEDIPAVIATAINQWVSKARGITDLLKEVSIELSTIDDDAELRDEFLMALEDWK